MHACDAGPRDIDRPVQSDVQLILIKMAGRAARVDIIIPSPRRRSRSLSLSLLSREGGREQGAGGFDVCARGRGNFVVPLRLPALRFERNVQFFVTSNMK